MSGAPTPFGAYGFGLKGIPASAGADLRAVGAGAPSIAVETSIGPVADRRVIGPGRIMMSSATGWGFAVEREAQRVAMQFPAEPPPRAVVHPLLTMPLSVLARWNGAVTLHGGAVEIAGGAWAILGGRESGKSTTLALLAERGLPVVADDLVVIRDGNVHSGPACIDLRPEAAERFPRAELLGEVAGRARYRLAAPGAAWKVPLGGVILLDWRHEPGVTATELKTGELLRALHEQQYFGPLGAPEPEHVLALLDRPAWRVSRPRDWRTAQAALDELVRVCGLAQ